MRILLINPPYIGWLNDVKVEPIGLLYIASWLRRNGHEVALHDAYMGESPEVFVGQMERWRPSIVACAVYTVSEQFCFEMARMAKAVDPTVLFVAGGPHASFAAERMLTRCPELDVIAIREAEETLVDIAACVARGIGLQDVPGIATRANGGASTAAGAIRSTPQRSRRLAVDEHPWPARDLLTSGYYEKYRAAGVISGRGCAYRCDFCVSPAFYPGVRQRKVADVAAEVRQVVRDRQVRHIRFYDDVFAYNLDRMQSVRAEFGPMRLTFDCYVRIDVTTPEMLEVMRDAGCVQVRFGVETGNELARSARKGGRTVSFEQHATIVAKCRQLGIETLASYILGFVDETRDDMMQTIAFADRLGTDRVGFYKLTPYPGTIYWNLIDAENVPLDNYTKFDNEVSVNRHLSSAEISGLVRLAYETYYRNRAIPYDNPDTLRFLTSLPKLRY